MKVFSQKI